MEYHALRYQTHATIRIQNSKCLRKTYRDFGSIVMMHGTIRLVESRFAATAKARQSSSDPPQGEAYGKFLAAHSAVAKSTQVVSML